MNPYATPQSQVRSYRPRSSSFLDNAYLAYKAGKAVAARLNKMKNKSSTKTYSATSGRAGNTGITTSQRDFRVRVKKKKRSKAELRQLRFKNKVLTAVNSSTSHHSVVETTSGMAITPTASAGAQNVVPTNGGAQQDDFRVGLYGHDSRGMRRVLRDMNDDLSTSTAFDGATTNDVKPFYENFGQMMFNLKGCKIEIAIENGTTEAVVIDIYECANRREINSTTFNSAYDSFNQADNMVPNTQTWGGGTLGYSNYAVTSKGTSPYNNPTFNLYWKILKKTRLNMSSGERITYNSWGLKKKNVQVLETLDSTDGTVFNKGMVKDFIFVIMPVGEYSGTGDVNFYYSKSYYFTAPDVPLKSNICARYHS